MTRGLPLLLLLVLWIAALPAHAQQPAGAAPAASQTDLAPAQARRIIDILQDPAKRQQLVETLRAIDKASPAPPTTAPPETTQPSPAEPAAKPAGGVALAPNSLGAQLWTQISAWPQRLGNEIATAAETLTNSPLLWIWIRRIAADPMERTAVLTALWQSTLIVGGGLLVGWLVHLAMARPIRALIAHAPEEEAATADTVPPEDTAAEPADLAEKEPPVVVGSWHLLRRLPFALMRLILELIPVAVFWATAMLLSGIVRQPLTHDAIVIVVDACATVRVVMSIARMLVSPAMGRLRLIDMADQQADYLIAWLRRITVVAIFGSALVNLARVFGLYQDAYDTLIRLVNLIVAVLLAILVLRCRRLVARRLHAPEGVAGGVARWRNWLAASWHFFALIAIAAAWMVASAGVRAGLGGIRVLIGSVLILVVARIVAIVLLGLFDRVIQASAPAGAASEAAAETARVRRYHSVARIAVTVLVGGASVAALLEFWGIGAFAWFQRGRIGASIASALLTIGIAVIAALIVWEIANTALERRMTRLTAAGSAVHIARLRTLLPILRAALLAVIIAIVGLTALSQIGVDIAPLLAGAGIVGVAVGFGSQKLVQDIITGLFVLFENAIQVGDWVTVAGLSGKVERLSVRTIWLRGGDGAVHVIPFSSVSSISNTNRGLGTAAVSVTIAYREDSDRALEALKAIAGEMQADEAFSGMMLGELNPWIDTVKASGVTLSGVISCTDAGRWAVQREFARRMHKRFQELGIQLDEWPGTEIKREGVPASV
jgi:small-conductance mechanosensitive channel